MKLNLACADKRIEGFENVDLWPSCNPDRVLDLFLPDWWMIYGESSVDEIYCGHFLEHIPHDLPGIPHKDGLFVFMDNCYHVLKPDARMKIVFPSGRHINAYIEPTHRRIIESLTFRYLDATWRRSAGMGHYPLECDFSYEEREMVVADPNYFKMSEDEKRFAATHLWNYIFEEKLVLTTHKPAREGREYTGL